MNHPATSVMHRLPHPSPQRMRLSPWALWFAILAAPLAWSIALLVNVPIAVHGCFPQDTALSVPIWSNMGLVVGVVVLIAVAISVAGGIVAWRNWHVTRSESEGSAHHLLEAGDGRTRFMAMTGMLCSGLFLLTLLFSGGMLLMLMVRPCGVS